ncbi:hypothetical protein [Thermodesulforhabdus norvegica]|uniref:Galactose-1-phosphate uridylyltransferase n=1 Tax=Thermodesulforhabdus norvegica TaxID=39841 RepID=A0A1I4VJ85_9BACT|nr:hypothetical protein [Thermodesulforhabdus norvegica]SFN01106.1 Galactose-1-phosphate uridylyltransferase [Thermodesulforhabdus norvegica]
MIRFESIRQTAEFHSPLAGGKLIRQEIEFRKDPLLGHVSIVNEAIRGKKEFLFPDTDFNYTRERAEATRSTCFLCDGKWETMTPKYPDTLLPGGRMVKNECVLFPNLFPLASYHAVVMVGHAHYRNLDEFSEDLLRDALDVSFSFIKTVWGKTKDPSYFTVNANYLPPAGASVIHPHLQVLGAGVPSTHHERVIKASRKFYEEHGRSFWKVLIEEERKAGVRYITCFDDSAHIIAAYSPIGPNEIQIVFPHRANLLEWTEKDIGNFAKALSTVLKAYHNLGFSTFNMACYGGPLEDTEEGDGCFARIITRQNMVPHHRTDDFYFQRLLGNEIAFYPPEELAGFVRALLN